MENIINYIKYRQDRKIKNTPCKSPFCISAKKYAKTNLVFQPAINEESFKDLCAKNNKKPSDFLILCNYAVLNDHSNQIVNEYTLLGETTNNYTLKSVVLIKRNPGLFCNKLINCIGTTLNQTQNVDVWDCINTSYDILSNRSNTKILSPYKYIIQKNIRSMVYEAIIGDIKTYYNDNADARMKNINFLGVKLSLIGKEPIYSQQYENVCSNKQLKTELCTTLDNLKIDQEKMSLPTFIDKYKSIHINLSDEHYYKNTL